MASPSTTASLGAAATTHGGMALRRQRLALGGLFVAAFLLRLLYLLEARSLPLFHHLISDGRAYVAWADAIRAGDLWSSGQQVFYQAPLYAYTLAAIRTLFGDSLWAIRLCQAAAGAVACVLLVIAGRRWFDRQTGWIAGIALALYAPAIFFDGVINKASLALLASVVVISLMGHFSGTPRPNTWAAAGLALGWLILLRENALLLVPVFWLWLWTGPDADNRGWRHHRGRCALLLATGLAVVLLPVAVRNLVIGGTFTLTTVQAGPNLWIGNNPQAEGTYRPLVTGRSDTPFERADAVRLAEQALGRELSPRQVSRYWTSRAWDFARAEPVAWLRLTGRKLLMVLHR